MIGLKTIAASIVACKMPGRGHGKNLMCTASSAKVGIEVGGVMCLGSRAV